MSLQILVVSCALALSLVGCATSQAPIEQQPVHLNYTLQNTPQVERALKGKTLAYFNYAPKHLSLAPGAADAMQIDSNRMAITQKIVPDAQLMSSHIAKNMVQVFGMSPQVRQIGFDPHMLNESGIVDTTKTEKLKNTADYLLDFKVSELIISSDKKVKTVVTIGLIDLQSTKHIVGRKFTTDFPLPDVDYQTKAWEEAALRSWEAIVWNIMIYQGVYNKFPEAFTLNK